MPHWQRTPGFPTQRALAATLLASALLVPATNPASATIPTPTTSASQPTLWVQNQGQWPTAARYQAQTNGGTMWLADNALWLTVVESAKPTVASKSFPTVSPFHRFTVSPPTSGVNLKLTFVNANPHPTLIPQNRQDTHISYFLGHTEKDWHPDVPVYSGVTYQNLYPHIDLALTGQGGALTLMLVAHPGANLSQVRLRVEGADNVALAGDHLRLNTTVGEVDLPFAGVAATADPTTYAFQPTTHVPNSWSLASRPSSSGLRYSTYLGGSGDECVYNGCAIAIDGANNAYVTGSTSSNDFPVTKGAFQTTCKSNPCGNTFVAKLNAGGTKLLYATYLGGSGLDFSSGIAVDGAGSAYVTGNTASYNFPVTKGAFQTTCKDCNQAYGAAFVVKLNAQGSKLLYGSYLGGGGNGQFGEASVGITLDRVGNAYVSGSTASKDFPVTTGAFQTTCKDCQGSSSALYIAKVNPQGSKLLYATFLGGSGSGVQGDFGGVMAVDGAGNAYVGGTTSSKDFPVTKGAFQTTCKDCQGNTGSAFVAKLNPQGSKLLYATFLGGSSFEYGSAIAVDQAGNAYLTGDTASKDFPVTKGAFQTKLKSPNENAFVVKLNAQGSKLLYGSFLGGSGNGGNGDYGWGIGVDSAGNAYLTGVTTSPNFPVTKGAFQLTCKDCHFGHGTAFVAKLNPLGNKLLYGSYLGGTLSAGGYSIAVNQVGHAYVTGDTADTDFPVTTGTYQTKYAGGFADNFVAEFNFK